MHQKGNKTKSIMKTTVLSKNSKNYTALFNHANKQYKNIDTILVAYIVEGQVYAIDYINTDGITSLAQNTCEASQIIKFK